MSKNDEETQEDLEFLEHWAARLSEVDRRHDVYASRTSPMFRITSKKDLIKWLESTNSFTPREITRLHRLPLFKKSKEGHFQLRKSMLPRKLANLLFASVFVGAGGWIAWILFSVQINTKLISDSAAAGILFGYAHSLISDFSVRHEKMVKKLEEIFGIYQKS